MDICNKTQFCFFTFIIHTEESVAKTTQEKAIVLHILKMAPLLQVIEALVL